MPLGRACQGHGPCFPCLFPTGRLITAQTEGTLARGGDPCCCEPQEAPKATPIVWVPFERPPDCSLEMSPVPRAKVDTCPVTRQGAAMVFLKECPFGTYGPQISVMSVVTVRVERFCHGQLPVLFVLY